MDKSQPWPRRPLRCCGCILLGIHSDTVTVASLCIDRLHRADLVSTSTSACIVVAISTVAGNGILRCSRCESVLSRTQFLRFWSPRRKGRARVLDGTGPCLSPFFGANLRGIVVSRGFAERSFSPCRKPTGNSYQLSNIRCTSLPWGWARYRGGVPYGLRSVSCYHSTAQPNASTIGTLDRKLFGPCD